jgi:hypothetical protein
MYAAKKKSITLSISHSIFLTNKQRYDLHAGKSIKIVGASMPVWFCKGTTSEPAEEVFCKYTINNKPGDAYIRRTKNNTYVINLPQIPEDYKDPVLSNDRWRKMSENEKITWYETHPSPLSSKNLLDIKDGGYKNLNFRIQKKANIRGTEANIIHFVLIKGIEELNESLID